MGDPAGIGPEIIVAGLADPTIHESCRPLVLGDAGILSTALLDYCNRTGRGLTLNVIRKPGEARGNPGAIDLIAVSELGDSAIQPGRPTVAGGRAMVAAIFRAAEMALRADIAAMVTCPISKALMHKAGYAFNPHGGEGGLFGDEEARIIAPAVDKARKQGMRAEGPFPADTLFHGAASGAYDAVVAMYHDQGLIPLKLLHFSDAVNITLGLPIIRTSVDHGTAYDIAGTGKADPSSLKAAISMAAGMAANRRN
ncbi:MAG: hypothetical protein B5M55_06150 [Desulfococcus sp. 4484_242]|nr:MAG: hypothetical protein B5M55_06150 [Desulfococcus sp. 4484_242]